ncbi:MAG: hypothetical protein LBE08_09470 [Bifidobacteriaceae bacterium]|nr:hypothetical protein [Bifidobacteriaceae bacterium]
MGAKLGAERLSEALIAQGPYAVLEVVDRTTSTNADLLERAGQWPHLTALLAEYQTHGRGRLHPGEAEPRTWAAPPRSSLIASVLLRPPRPAPLPATLLGLAFGWAAVQALDLVLPARAALKWPNDVVVAPPFPPPDAVPPSPSPADAGLRPSRADAGLRPGPADAGPAGTGPAGPSTGPTGAAYAAPAGGKLAGVLSQVAPSGEIVIGLGLNVHQTASQLPGPAATSLAALGAGEVDRTWLAIAYLAAAANVYERWARGEGELVGGIGQRMATLGRVVCVATPDGRTVNGVALRLDADGALVVRAPSGCIQRIESGEIV